MENEITAEKLLIKKEKLSLTAEQIIESDLSLADYYGDIVKILSCCANTSIYSSAVSGDKAVADGHADIRIIYIDSAGKTQVADCRVPWGKSVEAPNAADGDILSVTAAGEQMSCRAVDARRIEIRGSITLNFKLYGIAEFSYVKEMPEKFCHALKATTEGKFLQNTVTKQFSLTAQSEPSEKYKNAKIIRCSSQPTVTEIKTIKNKMMIRGSAACIITYINENGEFKTERISEAINQIIELDGIDENAHCCVALRVQSAECRITPENAQTPPKAEANLILCADIDIFRSGEITTLTDAYSSRNELFCKKESLKCVTETRQLRDNHTVTGKFDFSSANAESVCDAEVKRIKYNVLTDKDNIVIKGNIQYGIIIITKDGEKMYFERIADFEYKKQFDTENSNPDFALQIHLSAVSFSSDGNSEVTVTAELCIDGFVFACKNLPVITSIEKGAQTRRDDGKSVITVYFASCGEKIWDIARSHGTSAEIIKNMNELDCDALENDTMLIFELE